MDDGRRKSGEDVQSVRVDFYGRLAAIAGRSVQIDLTEGMTIASLRALIASQRPEYCGLLPWPSVRALVDDRLAEESMWVVPGSSVGFFPPVSGG